MLYIAILWKIALMARLPRLYSPDTPHLLQALLLPAAQTPNVQTMDQWASWLADETARLRIAVHGWAATPHEILLLATPHDANGLRSLLQSLGRRIATQRGGGRVFDGRYRTALIEPGAWVLPALMWVEMLPVRTGLAGDPEHWRWSSARAHTGASPHGWLSVHPDYWACGNTPFDRQARYRSLLHDGLSATQRERLDAAVHGQWALGSAAFMERMQEDASRRASPRPRGRPRKTPAAPATAAGAAGDDVPAGANAGAGRKTGS